MPPSSSTPPAALAADGHVDGEHSSEQIGPAETARARGVATVRRASAGEVEVEGELLPGRGDPRRREDASTKVVAICEHTEVPRRVNMRGRHEGAQAGEEPVRRHVGVGGPAARGGFEEDAHAAVGERHDSVVCEGRAEQIAADPFELLTVATVDGRRGVEMHPERCHRQRRPGRGLLRRDQMRAREPELHAGRERGVHVEVVVPGDRGDGLGDLRDHGREPLRRRRRRGHEAHLAAALLEGAVGDEGV